MSLFLISFASAESIGTFRQGENVTLPQLCSTCASNNITSILDPLGNTLLSNVEMDKDGSYFNYTLTEGNTTLLGTYKVNGIGDDSDCSASGCVWAYTFDITPSGKQFSTANSIIQFALLFLMVMIFIGGAIGITFLPSKNETDEEGKLMSISWLKYLRGSLWFVEYMIFVAILFMASNLAYAFLSEELFASVLFAIYKIAFGLAPVVLIIWIAWIFAKIFQDKKFWGMMQRGIFPQGRM